MKLYRLGSTQHKVWSGHGAWLNGGRWNLPGYAVIYTAGSLALAMLERLVQQVDLLDTMLVEATVPADVAVEDAMASAPPGWNSPSSDTAPARGADWLNAGRAALLRVPSAVVPREANYLVNPEHPEAQRIAVGTPEPLTWDPRLFSLRKPKHRR